MSRLCRIKETLAYIVTDGLHCYSFRVDLCVYYVLCVYIYRLLKFELFFV